MSAESYFDILRSMTSDPKVLAAVDRAEEASGVPQTRRALRAEARAEAAEAECRRWAIAYQALQEHLLVMVNG